MVSKGLRPPPPGANRAGFYALIALLGALVLGAGGWLVIRYKELLTGLMERP